jgi:biotin carboxyl carrier protein
MTTEPFRLTVNDRHTFDIEPEQAAQLDVVPDGNSGHFHVLRDNRSWKVEVLDVHDHVCTLRVDGRLFNIQLADRYERLVQQLGLTVGGSSKMNVLKAPMPGLVLQVAVEPGQTVQKGDTLVILEAMKMENVLKASGDGIIKSIYVQKGATIDKGQLLLDLQ